MTRSLFKRLPARRWATIALGLSTSLAALGAASAQNPAAATAESDTPDRVIVTGSNIPSAAEVGAAPVTTLDAAAIGRTGVDDPQTALLKSEPSFSGGGNFGQNNASVSSGTTQGGSALSLRGLQTLVLLNGRRVADAAAVASGGAQFQDVNLFPSALIKRIEVLKDGASAIYGSDAVGGVVNVILQDDFKGAAFSGRYGFTEKSDITDQRFSGVVGFGDEHTRIVVAAQYREQDPIFTRDRANGGAFATPFNSSVAGFTGTSSNFGGLVTIAGSGRALNFGLTPPVVPGQVATNIGSLNQVVAPASIAPVFNAAGQQVFSYGQIPAGTYGSRSALNLSQYTSLSNDQSSVSAYGSVERDIFDKHLIAFGDFLYTKNYAQSYLAPQPVTTASSPLVTQNMIIPLGAPFNPFNSEIGQTQGALGTTTATINGAAATAGGITVTNRYQAAPRVFRDDTNFYRFVGGLKGEIVKDLNYEVAFNHSEDQIDFKNFNLIRSDLVDQALAGGYNADGTAAPATFTTIANPVTGLPVQTVATSAGPYSRVNGVLLPALDAFALNNPLNTERAILGTQIQDQQSKLTVIDGTLNGFPVKLPAGPLGFALGGEYRREELRLNTSVQNFVASVPTADVQIGRGVEAGYIELSVPVISPEMKIPGIYSLDLDGAGRVEKYDDTNSNFVPKASFVLRPIVDIAVRGTYSKSFNEPNLIQTNGPTQTGFTSLVNLGGGFSEQANSVSTSNPNLGPVRTDTYDLGLVLSPHQVPGLTLSTDFFHIEQKGIVTAGPSATTILLQEATLGSASPNGNLVHFASANGPTTGIAPGAIVGNASNYYVVTSLANNSRIRESGLDFTANYDHDFGPKFGGLTLGLNGTYYLQYKTNDGQGQPLYDEIGLYLGAIGSTYVPQYKLVPYVEYRYGGASVTALMNYTPSLRDAAASLNSGLSRNGDYTQDGGPNLPKIRDYYTVDLTFNYEFGLNKTSPKAPVPSPKDGKDGKGGGKTMVANQEMAHSGFNYLGLLDGLKVTFGINNVTNARPPFIAGSPDSSNTDVSIYDPYQRLYYFVLSKKF